jgi:hypothetical protein
LREVEIVLEVLWKPVEAAIHREFEEQKGKRKLENSWDQHAFDQTYRFTYFRSVFMVIFQLFHTHRRAPFFSQVHGEVSVYL